MVLQANVAFLSHFGPVGVVLRKLAAGNHFVPFGCPKVVFYHHFTIEPMFNLPSVNHYPDLVPFANRLHFILRYANQVIQCSGAVQSVAAIGVGSVVEHLHFRSGLPNGHIGTFLRQIKNTTVATGRYFPFK